MRLALPSSVPLAAQGLVYQFRREASQPTSSTPATVLSGWWRTVSALICAASMRICGGSKVLAMRSRQGIERSHARSTT